MSASTGTRRERNVQTRATEALTEIDKEYIASLKVFTDSSNEVAGLGGGAISNSPKTPAGNYLARAGDSMIGPLALGVPPDFSIDVDASNTIDIGQFNNNPFYSSNLQLDDLQPNSSVLDIIAGAAFDGQILVLRTFAPTVPYTISQGTVGNGGNIQTGTSSDITVGDLQTIILIFDESLIINANTGGTWRVASISNPAGGSGNVPNGTTDLDHLQWNGAAWVALQDLTFTNDTGMVQWRNVADNGTVGLVVNTADELMVSPSNTGSQSFVVQSQDTVTPANIQSLSLSIGTGTVASTDAIISTSTANLNIEAAGATRMSFDATTGTQVVITTPAGVTAQSTFDVVSTHAVDPDQSIGLTVGSGTGADALLQTSANILELAVGNVSRWQIDINTGNDILQTGLSQTPSYTLFADGTPPSVPGPLASIFFDADLLNGTPITFAGIIANVLDRDNVNPRSSLQFNITDGTPVPAMALQIDGMIVQNGYVSIPEITEPGVIPGSELVIYGKDDGGDTKLFYKFGSTEVGPLGAGGGGEFFGPWTATHDAGDQLLTNLGRLEFTEDGPIGVATDTYVYKQLVNLVFNVPNGDGYLFNENGVTTLFGIGSSAINAFTELNMNTTNKIVNLADPTANLDAANKQYVDSTFDLSGIQDAKLSTDHETAQFDFEYWLSNAKQGDVDPTAVAALYVTPVTEQIYYMPVYIGERVRIERVGVDVGTVNINDMSVAIYDSYPTQNYPRTRLSSSTNITLNTTGIVSALFNLDVEPGLYWLAIWFDNGSVSTVRYWPGISANVAGWIPTNTDSGAMLGIMGYIAAGETSPTLPATAANDMSNLYFTQVPATFAKLVFNPN